MFRWKSLTAVAAVVALSLTGCAADSTSTSDAGHTHTVTVSCVVTGTDAGDASRPETGSTTCQNGATASAISANHGHTLAVPRADVAAGGTKTYAIRGSSSHPHSVTVTSAQFAQLRAGATVTLTSTSDAGHSHTVKVICA